MDFLRTRLRARFVAVNATEPFEFGFGARIEHSISLSFRGYCLARFVKRERDEMMGHRLISANF